MRRLLMIGTTIAMIATLAGCGVSETETTANPVSPTTTGTAARQTVTTTVVSTTTTEMHNEPWVEKDIVFITRLGDGATVTLDIYFPADPVDAPIVIEPVRPAVGDLVEQGVIVVTIGSDDLLGDEGPGGPEEIVAAGQQRPEKLECAIRFARARAAELGNDHPTVLLSGVSFGGGLAAQVGLFGETLADRWDEYATTAGPPRRFECEVTGGSTHVDAVIGMAGTYDLSMPIFDGMYGRAHQQEHNPEMQEFLASTIGANPDLTLRLIHGIYDDIPVENAEQFAEMLSAAGYDVQLTTWAGGHEEPPTELFVSTIMAVLDR